MALYIKKHWSKGAKIAGAIFFAVLMFVNIKLTTDPNANGDIDLLGLKLSLYTPSATAYGGGGGKHLAHSTACEIVDNGVSQIGWVVKCNAGGAFCNEHDCQ